MQLNWGVLRISGIHYICKYVVQNNLDTSHSYNSKSPLFNSNPNIQFNFSSIQHKHAKCNILLFCCIH
ncbi:hypothetical protein VNO80_09979 [Phaseolus coccineus]|uniref:Uncharacterized protein n=1 Tax=Phaseolus coccineus TaxID=3886 RepID=A0AAN9NCM8_PHACN